MIAYTLACSGWHASRSHSPLDVEAHLQVDLLHEKLAFVRIHEVK